jgi:hypothetical protein
VARVTIDKLVAHAQSRTALQSQMVGKLRVRTRAVVARQS